MAKRTPLHIHMHGGWDFSIYRTWDFPRDVVEKWDFLSLYHGDFDIFVNYHWFSLWWEAFGRRSGLFVAVLRNDGEIKAIFPCCSRYSSICSLTNIHSHYYDLLIEPEVRGEALSCFFELLRRIAPRSQIYFEQLPMAGENAASLVSELQNSRTPFYRHSQPWAPWAERPVDWSLFLDGLSGRLRNTLQRNRRKAEAEGPLSFETIKQSEQLDKVLDAVFDIEYRSWKGREGTAIKSRAVVERFYRRLASLAMEHGHLLLCTLKLGDTPIAADFCLCSGRTLFLLKPGYDEAFRHLSPGNLLHLEVFNYLHRDPAFSFYNFLGACDPWKMEWTRNTESYGWIRIYPKTLQGRIEYLIKYGWRSFLKRFRIVRQFKAWADRRSHRPAIR
ncbi:MAG TPA: GNAT family N-acetyltransferase [Dissulfurispiraceae bacterium]